MFRQPDAIVVTRPWGHLRTLRYLGAGPDFLAWPGLGCTAAYFGLLAEVQPWPILAVDPPGVGPVSSGLPHRADIFQWVKALTNARGTAFIFLGHSWGASVVLWLAAQLPERVRGVVLLDGGYMREGGASVPDEGGLRQAYQDDAVPVTEDLSRGMADRLTALTTRGRAVTTGLQRMVEADWVAASDGRYRPAVPWPTWRAAALSLVGLPPSAFSPVEQPILLVVPESFQAYGLTQRDLPDNLSLADYERRRDLALTTFPSRYPRATVRRIADMGHDVLVDQPHAVGHAIHDWLLQEHLL